MSKSQSFRVLAIDPGTRFMGVALLENGAPLQVGVETIPPGQSPHATLKAGRKIILRLIEDYRPQVLAVEKTFFANNRNSSLLNVFGDEIRAIGKRKKLKVLCFAPNTVRKAVCGNGRASKDDVARVLVARFPELKIYLTQDRRLKERFHQNMFDALALGILAAKTLATGKGEIR